MMDPAQQPRLPLAGLRVLDAAGRLAPHCGQLLALFGADVVVVDRLDDTTPSIDWTAFNLLKERVALDVAQSDGRACFDELAADADVIIEADEPLADFTPRAARPEQVHVVVTPFGGDGPRSAWHSTELVAQAAGGILYLSGSSNLPPAMVGMPLARSMAGAHAACAVMLALAQRRRSGVGATIDVSQHEAVANLLFTTQFMSYVAKQPGRRGEQPLTVAGRTVTRKVVWPCADGYVTWNLWTGPGLGEKNLAMFEWMREQAIAAADEFIDVPWNRMSTEDLTVDLLDRVHTTVGDFFRSMTKSEIQREARARRIMLYSFDDPNDVLGNVQLRAREAFRSIEIGGRNVEIVGTPARSTAYPLDLSRRGPVPTTAPEIVRTRWNAPAEVIAGRDDPSTLPLAGVRVLDLGWAVVSPITTKYLAIFGADVVKLEYRKRPDPTRMSGPYPLGRPAMDGSATFVSVNATKRSVGLDLNKPRARDLVLRLAAKADIVSENFAPGVAARMGYGYDALCEARPDVIALSLSMQGQTGPLADQPGLGNHLQAMSGIDILTGFPDGPPGGPNQVMPDLIGPWLTVVALLAALEHRRLTGEGQYLDISQFEAMFAYMQPSIIETQLAGRPPTRTGNRSPHAAPHGVYPTVGTDRWIAIAVDSDAAWGRLHSLLPPDVQQQFEVSLTTAERLARADALDAALAAWTATSDASMLAEQLQSCGIAASAVNDGLQVINDPQLAFRSHYRHVDHPKLGDQIVDAPSFRFDTFEPRFGPSPLYADDTVAVLDEWLGLDGDELAELVADETLDL